MAFQIFTPLFNKIDLATATFVTDISSRTIAEVTPIVTSGLTLVFILYGFLIIRGTVEMPVMDFLGRSVRVGIITSVALTGGLYQSHLADAIMKTPDELASALIPGGTQGAGAAALIDQAAEKGMDVAGEAFDKAGFLKADGLIYGFFGLLIIVVTGILIAIGGAFILIAKIALALLAGLGPLFIAALLFQATQRFFEMWAAQIFNYGLLIVIFSSVFGLMMDIFTSYIGDIKFDGIASVSYTLGGAVILSVAMIIVLLQLPSIATGLAGGLSAGFIHEARVFRGMVGNTEKKDKDGRVTRHASGAIGATQMMGRAITKPFGYFRGNRSKTA